MPALTSSYIAQRQTVSVPAPEVGEDVEIVVSEISALAAEEFRQFAQAKRSQSNGSGADVELGYRGIIKLLKHAIIDPDTGRPTFDEDQLERLITHRTAPAFNRAFVAAVKLNGYDADDDESAEGNVSATPEGASPTSSP